MKIRILAVGLFFFLSAAADKNAQSEKTVYYFVDALNTYDTLSVTRTYFYRDSIQMSKAFTKTLERVELNEFRKVLKANYNLADPASCVIRIHENYNDAVNLMQSSIQKYTRRGFNIVPVHVQNEK